MLGAVTRFAGQALKGGGTFLMNNAGKNSSEIAMRILPDLAFGGLAAAQTPGDFGDKLIAGTTQALGGVVGGIGTAGALKKIGVKNEALLNLADLGGSYGGDFAGMMIGDTLQRGKDRVMGGQGQTAWERMGAQQQAQYAQQLEQQILAQYGLIPGSREQYTIDPTTGMGVA